MKIKIASFLLNLSIKLRHIGFEWIANIVMDISEKIYASYMEKATHDYYYQKSLNEMKEN